MSEPTIVFVFSHDHWHNNINALSKLDLFDVATQVGVQFGYDFQSQAFMLVVTKSKWSSLSPEIKQKFMMISRRLKEEMEGPMNSTQREKYETTDLFVVFENIKPAPADASLETIEEEESSK